MRHSEEVLGFRPDCNFDRWPEELKAHPEEKVEKARHGRNPVGGATQAASLNMWSST